jgi:methylglutaconyl-CoA hydratase
MSESLVRVERPQTGIAIVTMKRAEKRNALNIALLRQLGDAIDSLDASPECRVLILAAEGPVFCAGLDLAEATQLELKEQSAEGIRRVISGLHESRLVCIGAATGSAYAGGAGLLAACDLVVASDDFQIGFPEVRRGLVAAMIWSVLSRKLRDGDLRELLLLGEPIPAARAHQIGLIHWIVPRDRVLEQSLAVATKVLAGGPEAVRETKSLLNQAPGSISLDALRELHERIRDGSESREGLAAFLEHREPHWCRKS